MSRAAEVCFSPTQAGPGFSFLSWDSEGGTQTKLNLLRENAGSVCQVKTHDGWVDALPFVLSTTEITGGTVYRLGIAGKTELLWKAWTNTAGMTWSLERIGNEPVIEAIRVTLPFNPRMAATSVLPHQWIQPDGFCLPAVLSAADFGQLLVHQQGAPTILGRYTGSRGQHRIDVAFEFPAPPPGQTVSLQFSPLRLPTPRAVDAGTWKQIRRGWWNVFEPCVQGDLGAGSVHPPVGVLANNAISDPVSSLYLFIADHAMLLPDLAPGVSAEYLLRHSVEWWLDKRTESSGAVIGYWDYSDMLDAPPSILAASWACVEMSGDIAWAKARIPQLERIADYLAARDIDHDGIIESPKSGNANTLCNPNDRGATAYDVINSGHKEIYINSLAYRAFCCMADIEHRLHRNEQADRYTKLAQQLRAAFYPTFYSPKTQLLSWWISADGQRHDYWAPGILGLPIAYGLVPEKPAAELLTRMHAKVKEVGFSRLDIGLPVVLTPICRADYFIGAGVAYGCPSREDGSDTFQHYLNGGCCVSDQIHWFNAHNRLGLARMVQPELTAMVNRQAMAVFPNGGSFQNGIVNAQPQGAEFYTWTGETTGYEGHLVYSWFFLQSVLTQHPEYLKKILRPIEQVSHQKP